MVLKMMRVKQMDVLGTALLSTVGSAILGLIVGILFLLASLYMGSLLAQLPLMLGNQAADAWVSRGLMGLILSPSIFAVIGFIYGVSVAFFANVALKRMNGLKLEVDLDTDTPSRDVPEVQRG
jgi:hypothetical protein